MDPVLESIWTHWHAHPEALIGLALLQGGYMLGVGPLRERYNLADGVEPRQIATFTAGVLVIYVALLSPIHVLSDNFLFSVHMTQHVLLSLVAPPLLLLGTPDWLLRPLLRPDLVFRAVRLATHPIIAFALFNVAFSLFHVPALYNASVTYHWLHVVEHLIFIGTAVLMWWPIGSMMPELPRLNYPLQMMYLFALSIAQIIVFAIVTFSEKPIYEVYANAPRVLNISPLLDQQIGALIMKVGGGTLFLTLLIIVFFRWFKHEEENNPFRAPERRPLEEG